jgi:hypothetical protein
MTVKISRVWAHEHCPNFEHEVEEHRKARVAHVHSKPIEKPGDRGVTAPVHHHPHVEHAIKRIPGNSRNVADNFIADFEWVEDMPTLDERRAVVRGKITAAAQKLMDAVITPGKLALLRHQAADEMREMTKLAAEGKDPRSVSSVARDKLENIFEQFHAINGKATAAMALVDDLSAEGVDKFVVAL